MDRSGRTRPLRLTTFDRLAVPTVMIVVGLCVIGSLVQKVFVRPDVVRIVVGVDPETCLFEFWAADVQRLKHAAKLAPGDTLKVSITTSNRDCWERPGTAQSMADELSRLLGEIGHFRYQAAFSLKGEPEVFQSPRWAGS